MKCDVKILFVYFSSWSRSHNLNPQKWPFVQYLQECWTEVEPFCHSLGKLDWCIIALTDARQSNLWSVWDAISITEDIGFKSINVNVCPSHIFVLLNLLQRAGTSLVLIICSRQSVNWKVWEPCYLQVQGQRLSKVRILKNEYRIFIVYDNKICLLTAYKLQTNTRKTTTWHMHRYVYIDKIYNKNSFL